MLAPDIAPARYFPVTERPLRMKSGLLPFPTDFGNGPRDAQFFQLDREAPRYRDNKLALRRRGVSAGLRHGLRSVDPEDEVAHDAVAGWIGATVAREHPEIAATGPTGPYEVLWSLQEDAAVVVRKPNGRDRTILMSVHAPSGWRPERLLGASFADIHAPVPDFVDDERAAMSLVRAMVERGPYVRFVWTVAADDHLDHHPEHGRRAPWSSRLGGFLRVERQITVPFPTAEAALFLIRTYLYPFASLEPGQRALLSLAIERMPATVARYKGLEGHRPAILAALAACD